MAWTVWAPYVHTAVVACPTPLAPCHWKELTLLNNSTRKALTPWSFARSPLSSVPGCSIVNKTTAGQEAPCHVSHRYCPPMACVAVARQLGECPVTGSQK